MQGFGHVQQRPFSFTANNPVGSCFQKAARLECRSKTAACEHSLRGRLAKEGEKQGFIYHRNTRQAYTYKIRSPFSYGLSQQIPFRICNRSRSRKVKFLEDKDFSIVTFLAK